MCFTKVNGYRKQLIAKDDIICYKWLDYYTAYNSFISPVRRCHYFFKDKVQPTILITESRPFQKWYSRWKDEIYIGLHTFISRTIATAKGNHFGDALFKAVIPKGSQYYCNPIDGEYVSNNLLIYTIPIYTHLYN